MRGGRRQRELPETTDPRFLLKEPTEDEVISEKHDAAAAARAAKTLEAEYTRPYIAHASIGPSCAVARFEGGRYTVWTHSQGIYPLRARPGAGAGRRGGARRGVHVEGAGCYGHNGADDAALDAALLARAVPGRPVRVQWMREDEFGWEPYGPAMAVKLKAALDAQGNVVGWTEDIWSNSHSTRPSGSGGINLLAAWHLAQPLQALAPAQSAAAGRRQPPQRASRSTSSRTSA